MKQLHKVLGKLKDQSFIIRIAPFEAYNNAQHVNVAFTL